MVATKLSCQPNLLQVIINILQLRYLCYATDSSLKQSAHCSLAADLPSKASHFQPSNSKSPKHGKGKNINDI